MSYGIFRAELIGRVLAEGLTPRQVGDILAERARQEKRDPINLAELSALYGAGDDWGQAHRAIVRMLPWGRDREAQITAHLPPEQA